HDSQNTDRPESYRNHNPDSKIEAGQRIKPESVLSERECRHRAANKYQNKRTTGHQKTVNEKQIETGRRVERPVSVQGKGLSGRQRIRLAENGEPIFKRVKNNEENGQERQRRIEEKRCMSGDRSK